MRFPSSRRPSDTWLGYGAAPLSVWNEPADVPGGWYYQTLWAGGFKYPDCQAGDHILSVGGLPHVSSHPASDERLAAICGACRGCETWARANAENPSWIKIFDAVSAFREAVQK